MSIKGVQGFLFLLGLGLVLSGLWAGQMDDVWTKAAYLCMECIGLG